MTTLHSSQRATSATAQQFADAIDLVSAMYEHVHLRAREQQRALSALPAEITTAPGLGPRFPAQDFNYLERLSALRIDTVSRDEALTGAELLDEVARFFHGAMRPQSDRFLYNMVPAPSTNAIAAAWLASALNVNCIYDSYGGESLLVEQQVARTIGNWAGWPEAMGIWCGGGKMTLLYAVRSAIARHAPESRASGLPSGLVIICGAKGHFSVEHVAVMLGLGSANCLRAPVDEQGQMDPTALAAIMNECHDEGKRVIAVIASGGTTVDFHCDDTASIASVVDEFAVTRGVQRPYLHLDSVIGWLYFSLFDTAGAELDALIDDPVIRKRIDRVIGRLAGIDVFDSFGVDFHKNGLCPYASSFFVGRTAQFMDDLGDGVYRYSDQDFEFGAFRALRYTLENSRPTTGILPAWVNLKSLGRRGLASYLVSLHKSREDACAAIRRHSRFRILNEHSLGWEIVFALQFSADAVRGAVTHDQLCALFSEYCSGHVTAGYNLPLFSIVPGYLPADIAAGHAAGFLIYPMNTLDPSDWDAIVAEIACQAQAFETHIRQQSDEYLNRTFEKPIR